MKGFGTILDEISGVKKIKDSNINVLYVDVKSVIAGRAQPRKEFNLGDIESLSLSISENGLINPIIIRAIEGGESYEIITGERRWRAVCLLGWDKIPAIIKNVNDRAAQIMALVENLQRENLTPIETALGYSELSKKHGLTHDEVATSVGKPRSSISNYLRLLSLAPEVQNIVKPGMLEMGHAKLLTSLTPEIQIKVSTEVLDKKLSVRQLETVIKRMVFAPKAPKLSRPVDNRFNDISVFLKRKLGEDFGVSISKSAPNKISFASEESLLKFMELLD